MKRFEEAEAAWLESIAVDPEQYVAYYGLIGRYLATGRYDDLKRTANLLRGNGGVLTADLRARIRRDPVATRCLETPGRCAGR
jgi:hypothetical protein